MGPVGGTPTGNLKCGEMALTDKPTVGVNLLQMRQQILGEDKLENDRTSVGVVFSNNQGSYVLVHINYCDGKFQGYVYLDSVCRCPWEIYTWLTLFVEKTTFLHKHT